MGHMEDFLVLVTTFTPFGWRILVIVAGSLHTDDLLVTDERLLFTDKESLPVKLPVSDWECREYLMCIRCATVCP